ncbi:hypothetical protein ACHWQZ_G017458 [Mnemiopsis leidyi]
MKVLLILTALVAGALSDRRSQFREAMEKFAQADGLPKSEPPAVVRARYEAFNQFADVVDEINSNPDIPFTSECNFLSILTEEERKAYQGFNASGHQANAQVAEERLVLRQDVPESRDFSDKIGGIKDQGSCGSCWTFAATAALEGEMYFKNSKQGMSLSEQEYMECSTTRDGCNGGWMEDCYTYTRKKGRIAPTSAAPYKGKDSRSCNYENVANAMDQAGVELTGNIRIYGDANLLQAASEHIVSVAIWVGTKFSSYKSGRYVDSGCNKQPNHAVAVVGYGKLDGQKYWKVRNSWGVGWGNKGYILMDREKDNMCYISQYSHIPAVQCANSEECNPANPDGDSDDGDDGEETDDGEDNDDGDDSDDGEEQKLCKKKIPLVGKCFKKLNQAEASCEESGIENCAIVKMNKKCWYAESEADSEKKFIELMMPCGNDDEGEDTDGSDGGKCDTSAGLVYCGDCNCCMHKHMCNNPM